MSFFPLTTTGSEIQFNLSPEGMQNDSGPGDGNIPLRESGTITTTTIPTDDSGWIQPVTFDGQNPEPMIPPSEDSTNARLMSLLESPSNFSHQCDVAAVDPFNVEEAGGMKMIKKSEEDRTLVDSGISETSSVMDSSEGLPGFGDHRTAFAPVHAEEESATDKKDTQRVVPTYLAAPSRRQTTELVRIWNELRRIHEGLNELQNNQLVALTTGNDGFLRMLLDQEAKLHQQYQEFVVTLNSMERQSLLTPPEMHLIYLIREELDFQMEQVTLYSKEATEFFDPQLREKSGRCCASLILVRSPFPMVSSKGKTLDKPVRVRLLKGANQELKRDSKFEATTTAEQVSRVPLQNVLDITKTEDKTEDTTELRLKIVNGSRMLPVTLKVSVPVTSAAGPVMLETLPSRPFVIITNESQFEDGNAALLRYLAFENGSSTEWPHFANVLQEHFMRVTKQADLINENPESMMMDTESGVPTRAMSVHDLEYLHKRFFNNDAVVTTTQFLEFWKWFGKVIVRMRSTKQIASMWRKGFLWAFNSRSEIEAALMQYPPGTFVTRFSERNCGLFAVAYRAYDQPVRHYLVKAEEISQQRTLPDFLCEIHDLTVALRVLYNDFGDEPLPPLFVPVSKQRALAHLCSSRGSVQSTGYDHNIGNAAHS